MTLDECGSSTTEILLQGGLSTKVRELADDGTKIDAIKVHRAETGVGLKEAKDAVEAYLGH